MIDNYYITLLKLANKAAKLNEVPVSALIVKNGKIISKAINKREKKHCITAHAEIIAIKKASKRLKSWHLNECDLYVTLKPCSMCESVIKQSRINNVYYILEKDKSKKEYNKLTFRKIEKKEYEQKYEKILKDFFQKKRQ